MYTSGCFLPNPGSPCVCKACLCTPLWLCLWIGLRWNSNTGFQRGVGWSLGEGWRPWAAL